MAERSSGAGEAERTEVLVAAFVDFLAGLRVHVELVRVENADVGDAFLVDQHVLGLQRWSPERTQDDLLAAVEGV